MKTLTDFSKIEVNTVEQNYIKLATYFFLISTLFLFYFFYGHNSQVSFYYIQINKFIF